MGFVEQLGTRPYQAFGLLTALVGIIALYSFYSMDDPTPRHTQQAANDGGRAPHREGPAEGSRSEQNGAALASRLR